MKKSVLSAQEEDDHSLKFNDSEHWSIYADKKLKHRFVLVSCLGLFGRSHSSSALFLVPVNFM